MQTTGYSGGGDFGKDKKKERREKLGFLRERLWERGKGWRGESKKKWKIREGGKERGEGITEFWI